jgi:geranylgeranyl diphosphate synthase type I
MGVSEQLSEFKEKLDANLKKFFDERIREVEVVDPSAVEMMKLLQNYTLRGGKRIRAALIYYGYRCFKKGKERDILRAAMSIELIQSYLLIHDDIIDRDDLRRHGPTIHKSYKEIHLERFDRKDPHHFGNSMAIMAGDILSSLATQLLAYSNFNKDARLKAIIKLNQVIHKVVYGEVLDVLSEVKNSMSENDIRTIHKLKTASYTIEGPLQIGAILAGASYEDIMLLSEYALPLGEAFQIYDDILGLYGDAKSLGKPIGSDIIEGKMTLLMQKAIEKSNRKQKAVLKKALGNRELTKKQLDEVRRIVKDTGSLDYSIKLSEQLVRKARRAMERADFRPEAKEFLMEVTDYLIKRTY